MTRSKLIIKKKCEYCGGEFTAGKITARCCSANCSKAMYKQQARSRFIAQAEQSEKAKTLEQIPSNRMAYSIAEVAQLTGRSRETIRQYAIAGIIKAKRITRRTTMISKAELDAFLQTSTAYLVETREQKPVTEWYKLQEVTDKYGIKYSRLNEIINSEHIPKKKEGLYTLIAKKPTDQYFKRHGYDAAVAQLSEWLSLKAMCAKYGMSESAANSFIYNYRIPKKRINGTQCYSKYHIELIKNKANETKTKKNDKRNFALKVA